MKKTIMRAASGAGGSAAGEYNYLTFGCNWYWSDRIRIMFEWINPVTSASSTTYSETNSDLLTTRFHLNW